jgi:hypothetical protein
MRLSLRYHIAKIVDVEVDPLADRMLSIEPPDYPSCRATFGGHACGLAAGGLA